MQRVIDELSRLPGIGPKTAGRLTFYLLTKPETDVTRLGEAIVKLREGLVTCSVCFTVAESDPCLTCADTDRNPQLLLVVEEPLDVVALERAGWDGRYHVLGGVISPMNGIGPDQLRVRELFARLTIDNSVREVILGTDPSLEGEATALYIQQQIAKRIDEFPHLKTLKVTRLARGLPVGSDLEYADELTLQRALEGRKEY
ncbi:recombination protein RecR [Candidatus Berkelbacteria bacterium]|nr:recombination protein RecR [Candidatus Berkelbacteria bacterium]